MKARGAIALVAVLATSTSARAQSSPPPGILEEGDAPRTDATPPSLAPDAPDAPDAPIEATPALGPGVQPCRVQWAEGDRDGARACVQVWLGTAPDDHPDHALAEEMLAVLEAPGSDAEPSDDDGEEVAPEAIGWRTRAAGFFDSGSPELIASTTLHGGVAGFLVTAAYLSYARTNSFTSTPWLFAGPAAGMALGLGAGTGLALAFDPDPGSGALVASGTWLGTGAGLALELVMFEGSDKVTDIPLRFLVILGTSLSTATGAAALATLLDVSPGDVAMANSAAVWTAILGTLGFFTAAPFLEPEQLSSGRPWILGIGAASTAAYLGALALHPLWEPLRPTTWLVEAGGAAGFILASSLIVFSVPFWSPSQVPPEAVSLVPATLGAGTAAGVAAGAAGGVVASWWIGEEGFLGDLDVGERPSFGPLVLESLDGDARPVVGMSAGWRFR